ncbi:MAG: HDOD domain-containing protein [candidate division Zixibacteria bacterium]|nr:HDOD domain-containing protein [candidate division Zixibacteria bacterium]
MERDQVLAVIQKNDEISTLPQTLVEILAIIGDENSSADDMAKIIKRDISLTAKVLRVANSPYYGRLRGVSTVSSAIVLLGFRAVKAIVLSVSVYEHFKTEENNSIDLKLFWKHCLEVAILSRNISEKFRYEIPEEAFVTGLLHDMGILILHKHFPEEYAGILNEVKDGKLLYECENEVFGCNHADVIGFLAEKWNLPENMTVALANHHSLPLNPANEILQLEHFLNLSDKASKFSFDFSRLQFETRYKEFEVILRTLGITKNEMATMTKPLLDEIITTAQFLDIDIGSPMELVSSANEMLYELFVSMDNLLREQVVLQEQVVCEEKRKSSIKALRIILATFSHYINNATASILGRAQLLGLSLSKGDVIDNEGIVQNTVDVIQKSIDNINAVLQELKVLEDFDTVPYYENSSIINIENNVRRRLKELEMENQQ